MKRFTSFRSPTKTQRRGILWTFALFFVMHIGLTYLPIQASKDSYAIVIDSLSQKVIDSLIIQTDSTSKDTIYPFNPNYITDFKAYQLGISMDAVYRIRAYRKQGNYIQSLLVFKQLTQMSETEIKRIQPYLKLPIPQTVKKYKPRVKSKKEFNGATKDELKKIHGIGEAFASRIIAVRGQLGGFMVKDQLNDVWGIPPETISAVWEAFVLDSIPVIEKKNINRLTISQLASNFYLNTALASRIVAVRTQIDQLNSWSDLSHIQPLDSIKRARLSLYLSFD
ncbi:MAG: helix-hairpin-helix domain-containing protein [Flavobacteriaceae bacterium]|nr:helix-hairpin-helix domain-containing protein [Flavobacteriaceae bacterium]